MPQFIMDTSGEVSGVSPVRWQDLDAFTQAYIEAMFFTETASNAPTFQEFVANYESGYNEGTIFGDAAFNDLAPETLADIIEDCDVFQEAYQRHWNTPTSTATDEQAGHDFWLTRNHHGAGFWDRPDIYGKERAEKLTEAAHAAGSVDLSVGDDGAIYAN